MKIDDLLIKLSIYPNKLGYEYIKYILQVYDIATIRSELAVNIIPLVAKRFNVTASSVERAIRYAFSVEEVKDRLNILLKLNDDFKITKLKSNEFLCLLKHQLQYEGGEKND